MFGTYKNTLVFACLSVGSLNLFGGGGGPSSLYEAGSSVVSESPYKPFVMLIDRGIENPSAATDGAVTRSFFNLINGLYEGMYVPFIVSDSIVDNLLSRTKIQSSKYFNTYLEFMSITWEIYKVEDTSFMLFVPMYYTQMHSNHGLRFDGLSRLSSDPGELFFWLQKHKSFIPFAPEQLNKIFQVRSKLRIEPERHDTKAKKALEKEALVQLIQEQKELPIWNIIAHGHGLESEEETHSDYLEPAEAAKIAGMPAKIMQKLLLFFNRELYMGTLFLQTCKAGGKNIDLLQFDQIVGNNILLNLNYIVIVGSISNISTLSDPETPKKWRDFFTNTSSDPKKSFDELLRGLSSTQERTAPALHASSNIPQVWVPGGYGFQTYQVDKRIKVLSKALVAAHEDENRPIIIPKETEVILIYPEQINVPVYMTMHVSISKPWELEIREAAWNDFPSVAELLNGLLAGQIDSARASSPALDQMILAKPDFKAEALKFVQDGWRYPQCIAMQKVLDKKYHFARINLAKASLSGSPLLPFGGIMHFIRDAFVPSKISNERITRRIEIEKLKGLNDFSLFTELIRAKQNNSLSYPSAFELAMRPHIGQNITLYNVLIEQNPETVTISFEFQGKQWQLIHFRHTFSWAYAPGSSSSTTLPTIEEKDRSISEVLRKKLESMKVGQLSVGSEASTSGAATSGLEGED